VRELEQELEQEKDPDVIETAGSISIKGKEHEPEKTKWKKKTGWHFTNATLCPRCGTHDTTATSTKGRKQYRICRRGHCRYRYCVIGVKKK